MFTEIIDGKVRMRNDRPFLLISSTSWTSKFDGYILLNISPDYRGSDVSVTKLVINILFSDLFSKLFVSFLREKSVYNSHKSKQLVSIVVIAACLLWHREACQN